MKRRTRKVHPEPDGFVLPLAVGGSLVLLLSSLSLQTVALQAAVQARAAEEMRRAEDDLHSAAHDLAAAVNRSHPCLATGRCALPAELRGTRRLAEPPLAYGVITWIPAADGRGAVVLLELRERQESRRGEFQLVVEERHGQPLVVDIRALGLRGATS